MLSLQTMSQRAVVEVLEKLEMNMFVSGIFFSQTSLFLFEMFLKKFCALKGSCANR